MHVQGTRWTTMAASMILSCGAAAGSVAARPVSPVIVASSADSYFSCRNKAKSALIPSCLSSSMVPSCPHYSISQCNHQPGVLPPSLYSFPSQSWSHSSFIGSGDFRALGLAVGLNGKFVQELRRKSSSVAGLHARGMAEAGSTLENAISKRNSLNAVVLYSKSWCPYCGQVKSLFNKLGVSFDLVELDDLADEQEVQEALRRLTGQSTVPNVFIGGKHIGGCDDTMALHEKGELLPTLKAAGATISVA